VLLCEAFREGLDEVVADSGGAPELKRLIGAPHFS